MPVSPTHSRAERSTLDSDRSILAVYSVKPEELTSFETGFKSETSDRRNRFLARSSTTITPTCRPSSLSNLSQLLFNADAEVTGAELEWTGFPTDALQISAGISYLDTTVKDVADAAGVVKDREMVLAPKFSMNAMARYTWDLSGGSALAAQLDGNYSSSVYFDNINVPGTEAGVLSPCSTRACPG